MSTICEKRIDNVVAAAVEGSGIFYAVRFEPIPSKTCFDVTLKTYAQPSSEYIITVTIPKTYPFTPPTIICKKDKKVKFRFLEKSQWKPTIGIREVLIEACHVVSRRDLSCRQPVLPRLRPPFQKTRGGSSKSPQRAKE